jgi:hypothetical protein
MHCATEIVFAVGQDVAWSVIYRTGILWNMVFTDSALKAVWTKFICTHPGPFLVVVWQLPVNSALWPRVLMCFVWTPEQTAIIYMYNINWLGFITETECVYCAVRTEALYFYAVPTHSVFMCFVWFWGQKAMISLHSINWLVFITETECLLRDTDWSFIYNSTFCLQSCISVFYVDLGTKSDYFPI